MTVFPSGETWKRTMTEMTLQGTRRAPEGGSHIKLADYFGLRAAGVIYAWILLIVFLAVVSSYLGRPPYLSELNVSNLLEQAAFAGILALAMGVLLISGSFDLSVGSLTALCALAAAYFTNEFGVAAAIPLTLAVGLIAGTFNGVLCLYLNLSAFIVTLGTLSMFRGLALLLSEGRTILIQDPEQARLLKALATTDIYPPNLILLAGLAVLLFGYWFFYRHGRNMLAFGAAMAAGIALVAFSFGYSYTPKLKASVVVWFGLALLFWGFMSATVYGKRIYAVGGNERAAQVAGVMVKFYKTLPFTLVGLAAGIAGTLFAGRLGAVDPNSFTGFELIVIAAAVVGGISILGGQGHVLKSMVGALLLFTINNGFNMLNINAHFQLVFAGIVVIAAAALYVATDKRRIR